MNQSSLRVVKLGGSLLDFSDWPTAFQHWLRSQPTADTVLLVGGGRAVDSIRAYDALYNLPAADAHWLAVAMLSVTARLAAALMPDCELLLRLDRVREVCGAGGMVILDPHEFLRRDEPALEGCRLPSNWDVTSDSIAARIAEVLGADELVLLKSKLPAGPCGWNEAAERGIVDRHFPLAAAKLPCVQCVNLRDPQMLHWQPTC